MNDTPIEVKEAYVEAASRLLGLRADATVERMSPKAMDKIDEFLQEVYKCNRVPSFILSCIGEIINTLLPRKISNVATAIIEIKKLENAIKRQNPIFAGCYFAAKNKYAQELQYIFFMGE